MKKHAEKYRKLKKYEKHEENEEKWRKMKKHEEKSEEKWRIMDYKTKISIHMPSETPGTHTDGTWKEILVL